MEDSLGGYQENNKNNPDSMSGAAHEEDGDLPPMVSNYNVPTNPNRVRYGNDPLAEYRVRQNPRNWRHAEVNRETPWRSSDDGGACDKFLGTHALRNLLVIMTYGLVLAYISSIRLIAKDTNNWADSRVLGYSQSELCWSMNHEYLVMSNITVVAEDKLIDVDINSIFMDVEGEKYICFKDLAILRTLVNDSLVSTTNLDERFLHSEDRYYFPFDEWIITLACIGIFLCILCDESRIRGDGRTRYQVMQDKLAIKRTNFFIGLAVGIGLLFSVQGFRAMHVEVCNNNSGSEYDEFQYDPYCDRLSLYGVEVRSIIYPSEFLARHYAAFIMILSLLVLSVSTIRNVMPTDDNSNAVHDEHSATMRRIRSRNRLGSTDVDHIEGLISFLYSRNGGRNQHERGASEQVEPEIALPSLEKWKFFKESPDRDKQECPICLGDFAMPPTPRPSVKASTHDEVNDGDFGNYVESDPPHDIESSFSDIPSGGRSSGDDLNAPIGEGGGVGGTVRIKPEAVTLWDTGNKSGQGGTNNAMDIAQLPCGHLFHRICILNWSIETGSRTNANRRGASCPVCRVDLME